MSEHRLPDAALARPVALVNILAELLQGYRRPAVVTNESGTVVCMNAVAIRSIDRKPDEESDGTPTDPQLWPRRATFSINDQTYYLAVPDQALEAPSTPEPQLPPRLAKIARLVISGCTDKQIAGRTGLSFSTVRTYVRQIYRRIGVHSRVELVHASSATQDRR
jgi:DNA-binding CsgD family transcriptional regulator